MYFQFFYQVAPICLVVGIPFLFILIGTAIYNSMVIKRDRAVVALGHVSGSFYIALTQITKAAKDLAPQDKPELMKDFDTKKNLIRRAIELSSAEKIKSAENKLVEFIETPTSDEQSLILLAELKRIYAAYKHASKKNKVQYNRAAKNYNDSLKHLINRPVTALMNMTNFMEL
jgi:hypothetical protein